VVVDAGLERRRVSSNAMSIFVPLTGLVIALLGPPTLRPTALTWSVFVVFFLATVLGVMLGLHRYFTHGAFKTVPVFRALLGVLGSWALQGPLLTWVADHRRHHKYADRQGDPHSPYWREEHRFRSRVAGLLHAHFLWMLRPGVTDARHYAPDILNDRTTRWLSQAYPLVAASSLAAPALVGYIAAGFDEAIRCFLWAGCFRVVALQQFTWAVNSFGHMFGAHEETSRDESRDNAWTLVVLGGEGLHNYHHRYPYAAINAPVYFDPLGVLVICLERVGLVWDVRRVR
jgi:stearoyl-CoA desaturase (delta-9 desaturase)